MAGSANDISLVVAAMDFGTTYSGYAFSLYSDRDNPSGIHTNPTWAAGSQQLMSLKNPTCVLLKPNKEFHSFGFAAEDHFGDLADDGKHEGWFFFRRFKMALFETENLNLNTTIEDITGKKMPAVTIFAHAIRFLKQHLFDTLHMRYSGIQEKDIIYVITVPAIWDEKAKQFMIAAANEAGIKTEKVRLALEPEAASIWCQLVTKNELSKLSAPGTKYMVLDLGGGTADITAHEKLRNGTLKELHSATGGAWGGNEVDKAYIQFLTDIVGEDCMARFKTQQTADYFDVLRNFEVKKRKLSTTTGGNKITFNLPASLVGMVNMQSKVSVSKYKSRIEYTSTKLRVDRELAISLFQGSITNVVQHLKSLFAEPVLRDVDAILLVGGYSECQLVQEAIEKNFKNKRLICPDDPGLAVLKGAVRFGHTPELISTRVSRYAFGREAWPDFDGKVHPGERMTKVRNKPVCKGVFRKMVDIGEEIPIGKVAKVTSRPIDVNSKQLVVNVYSSTTVNTKYVDEKGCQLLGTVTDDLPAADSIEDKRFDIEFEFGGTNIEVKVFIPNTNSTKKLHLKCLF